MGDMLRRELAAASQVALSNSIERLEARITDAKATMEAGIEHIRETLSASVQAVESRVLLLEVRSEQALHGPLSKAVLPQPPHCATKTTVEAFRLVSAPQSCCPRMASSLTLTPVHQHQRAGSPTPVTPSYGNRVTQEQPQTFDKLQERLAGKVSGSVFKLNQSCEARSGQHSSRKGSSSVEPGHPGAVLSRRLA